MKRRLRIPLILLATGLGMVGFFTVRTPSRQAAWLADFDRLEQYLATAGANFDWVVAKRGLDLPALDSVTRREIAGSWTSLGAAWTARAFVKQFRDGHTVARIRPNIWWAGMTGREAGDPEPAAAEAESSDPGAISPALVATLDAKSACSLASLDVAARPEGWSLPFPEAAGAELLADEEFPAVLLTLPDGRKIGILRVATFGHEHYGPTCARAWEEFRRSLTAPCTGDGCKWALVAATMKNGAARAADIANELTRRGAIGVVVDLTRNGGGSEFADAMARALTPRPLHIAPGGFIRHPLHVAALEEEREAITADLPKATPAQRPLLDAALRRLDSLLIEVRRPCDRRDLWHGAAPTCSNVIVTPPAVRYAPPGTFAGLDNAWALWGPAWHAGDEGRYQGPLFILQDGHSASASEEFAARLRDNDAAWIIGERSYGAGCGYSNGGTRLELYALGLLVRAPDCQRLRMDGTNETEGITPDLDAGWTAEDTPEGRVTKAIAAIGRMVAQSR